MTSVHAVSHRLITQRLEVLLSAAVLGQVVNEPARIARVAAGALALIRLHSIDDKGRCLYCTRRRSWHPVRARPCTVHAVFNAYLTQPADLVNRQIAELLRHHRPGGANSRTMPLPRQRDW